MTPWVAALAGLLGSGHCAGMCGGLVSACFLRLGARRGPLPHAAYHLARLAVYTAVGALAGAAGDALTESGRFGLAQGVLQIVVGLAVAALGLDVLGWLPFGGAVGFAPAAWARSLGRRAFAPEAPSSPWRPAFLAGLANGLMPCSLTLSIAVQSAASGSAASGALLMAAFGAGTLPSMLSVGWLFARLGERSRRILQKAAALLVIGMGAAQVWQGLVYTRVMGKLVW